MLYCGQRVAQVSFAVIPRLSSGQSVFQVQGQCTARRPLPRGQQVVRSAGSPGPLSNTPLQPTRHGVALGAASRGLPVFGPLRARLSGAVRAQRGRVDMRRQTNWLFLTAVCLIATVLLAYASWQGFVGWVYGRGGDVIVDTTPDGPSWWGINNRHELQCFGPPDPSWPSWVAFTIYAGHTRVIVAYPEAAVTKPTAAAP